MEYMKVLYMTVGQPPAPIPQEVADPTMRYRPATTIILSPTCQSEGFWWQRFQWRPCLLLCMFGVLEASWFEAITMEEPFRWHSFKLRFPCFPYCLTFVGCHWRCFCPHLPFSFSTCHVFQLCFPGASYCQWHCCT